MKLTFIAKTIAVIAGVYGLLGSVYWLSLYLACLAKLEPQVNIHVMMFMAYSNGLCIFLSTLTRLSGDQLWMPLVLVGRGARVRKQVTFMCVCANELIYGIWMINVLPKNRTDILAFTFLTSTMLVCSVFIYYRFVFGLDCIKFWHLAKYARRYLGRYK